MKPSPTHPWFRDSASGASPDLSPAGLDRRDAMLESLTARLRRRRRAHAAGRMAAGAAAAALVGWAAWDVAWDRNGVSTRDEELPRAAGDADAHGTPLAATVTMRNADFQVIEGRRDLADAWRAPQPGRIQPVADDELAGLLRQAGYPGVLRIGNHFEALTWPPRSQDLQPEDE